MRFLDYNLKIAKDKTEVFSRRNMKKVEKLGTFKDINDAIDFCCSLKYGEEAKSENMVKEMNNLKEIIAEVTF